MKMKIFQYIKSHLIISFILLLVIIAIIMLPIYFLVINKSSSQEDQAQARPLNEQQAQDLKQIQAQAQAPPQNEVLGFIYSNTTNGIEGLKQFFVVSEYEIKDYDEGFTDPSTKIQQKWIYDKTNIYTIERTILNTKNSYTQDELSALGKTSKPNTYLVNQVIAIYDLNNPYLSRNFPTVITPMILSTYENYKNLYPNG